MLSCPTAAPVCITDATGFQGHWAWGCLKEGNTTGTGFLDPSIISNGVQPPHIDSPIETLQRVEQLRQLRLQNQQIEEQLRTAQQLSTSGSPNIEPSLVIAIKAVYSCGVLDGMLKAMTSDGNAEAASGIREALKQTACDQIRQYAGNEGSSDNEPNVEQRSRSGTGEPLNNADIVQMVKIGVKESTVLYMIDLRPARYSLGYQDRANLQSAGVSDSIIKAMIEKVSGN
jgi:hypothetical protein